MNVAFEEDQAQEITKTEKESIMNNLGTLASTPYGTIPLLRGAGVHLPEDVSEYQRNMYATELVEQAEEYEDRAEVTDVTFLSEEEVKVEVTYGSE